MQKKITILAACVCLSSCVKMQDEVGLKPALMSIPKTIARNDHTFSKKQIINIPNFEKIIVENGLSVKISKSNHNRVLSKSINMIYLDGNEANTLKISSTKLDGKVNYVYLQLKHLPSSVVLNGTSNIHIKAPVGSKTFKIIAKSKGNIKITGNPNISSIENLGGSNIYAYWLRGKQINIKSSGGKIFIAGGSNHLIAQLSDSASLDAKDLKTNHIWINSSENSKASLTPLVSLDAVASGNSQISYFNQLHENQLHNKVFNQANVVFVNDYTRELKLMQTKKSRHVVLN